MHGHEHGQESEFRPRGDRVERDDHDLAARAAAAGRPDVLGAGGMLGLQRAAGNAGVTAMMAEERSPVLDVVGSGGGAPLDQETRTDMEARFGTGFGHVRVHTGSAAHQSAKSVNAQAYTVGPNIVFQDGKYDPSSDAGRHMIAHELTHVQQQSSGPVEGTDAGGGVKVSDPSDRFEREAVANADRLMSAPAAPTATAGVQRAEEGAEEDETPVQGYVQRQEEASEEEEAPVQGYVQREEEAEEETPA